MTDKTALDEELRRLHGRLELDYAGRAFGQPDRTFHFAVDMSLALTVVDGRVRSHVDYIDTESFTAQLQRQLRAQ